jgi:arylsulfatase A-like enzyme
VPIAILQVPILALKICQCLLLLKDFVEAIFVYAKLDRTPEIHHTVARQLCRVKKRCPDLNPKRLTRAISLKASKFNRPRQMRKSLLSIVFLFLLIAGNDLLADERPNVLFCIADDWGWPHAGAYGDPVVKTPAFDRLVKEGVLFDNAYISAPSCTPSRNAILTGQYHWRLAGGGNLHSVLDTKHKTYPHLLADSGYFTGHWRKSWGPGKVDNWLASPGGHPAGKKFGSFNEFIDAWPREKPFCFWLGASDPHRGYKLNSGRESGMDISKIKLFDHYPDSETIRSDVADYYFEVQRFDSDVAAAITKLEELNVLENTIVVMTGDHGMPFPRCKANLYDSGARVPMAVRWPKHFLGNRVVTDFVSTTDLAPTFLDLAGVPIPDAMTGKSWMKILKSDQTGRVEPDRDHVLTGKERHVPCQEKGIPGGTPMRAIRTDQYLLIHNYKPDRWPAGTPNYKNAHIPSCWIGDCDNGPTKTYMVDNKDKDDLHRRAYDLAFAKRPEWELYDMSKDPSQLNNVAGESEYAEVKKELTARLTSGLLSTGDPRETGDDADEIFDTPKYLGNGPRHPSFKKPNKKKKRK